MPYPYGVEYNPENKRTPVIVWEGPMGQGRAGAELSIQDALLKKFRLYFERTDTLWFRDMLEKMSQGVDVSIEEIKRRAQQ